MLVGFFIINHPAIGVSPFLKSSIYIIIYSSNHLQLLRRPRQFPGIRPCNAAWAMWSALKMSGWLSGWLKVMGHLTPPKFSWLRKNKITIENYILLCLLHFRELGHIFMINHDKSASLEETHLAEKCWLWLGGYCNPFWKPSINQPRYQAFQHVYVSCVETTLIRWQKWDSWIANPQLEFNCRMSVGNTLELSLLVSIALPNMSYPVPSSNQT